jgi:drug/metabolite transporter (DMT)-like permease
MKTPDVAQLLLLSALWGASFVFVRMAVPEFGALALTGVRVGGAALCLVPLLFLRGAWPDLRTHWKPIALVGLTNSAVPFVLFSYGALALSGGMLAIFNAATALFAALIGWLWLRNSLTPARIAGLAIGFAGVVWLAWDKASLVPGVHGVATGWAVAACLLATVLYGFSANFTKHHLADVSPVAFAAGSQIVSTLVLAGPAAVAWPATVPGGQAWFAAALLAIACTAIPYVLFFRLIAKVGVVRATTISFLIPAFGMFWGAAVLSEAVTAQMVLGCLVILAGTALTTGILGEVVRSANTRRAERCSQP